MHFLGAPCGDIHLGHFKKTRIELNWIEFAYDRDTCKCNSNHLKTVMFQADSEDDEELPFGMTTSATTYSLRTLGETRGWLADGDPNRCRLGTGDTCLLLFLPPNINMSHFANCYELRLQLCQTSKWTMVDFSANRFKFTKEFIDN